MAKNAQLHLFLNSDRLDKLKEEAFQKDISVSELCRQKLSQDPQSTRIEEKVNKILLKLFPEDQ